MEIDKNRNIWSVGPLYGETKPKNEKELTKGKGAGSGEIQTITRKIEQLATVNVAKCLY